MNGKYLGVVIGAVVAIMLVGGVLMPIINEQATTTEETTIEGVSPLKYAYVAGSTQQFQQIRYTLSDGVITITQGDTVQTITASDADIPLGVIRGIIPQDSGGDGSTKVIASVVYTDSHIKLYWPIAPTETIVMDAYLTITVSGTNPGLIQISCETGGGSTWDLDIGNIQYTILPDATSEYELYMGEYPGEESDIIWAFALEDPAYHDWYLGPVIRSEEVTDSPYSAIYLAIPIVILVALLTAVAFVAFRRDY